MFTAADVHVHVSKYGTDRFTGTHTALYCVSTQPECLEILAQMAEDAAEERAYQHNLEVLEVSE